MKIKLEDRVFLGERRGAFRVVGFGTLHGERAVALIRNAEIGEYRRWRELQKLGAVKEGPPFPFEIVRRVPVADLVRDTDRRGWRERFRQVEMEFENGDA